MKKILFLLAIVGIFTVDYLYNYRYYEIVVGDVSLPQTLVLVSKNKNVVGLEAYIEGYLDDTAKIGNLALGKGEVKTTLHSSDYYVDTFLINYIPYKAKAGNLTVKYRFNTL